MNARPLCICVTAVLALGLDETAWAQPSRVDVVGGYQFTDAGDQTLPIGWSADVAARLNNSWSVVAEVSGAYRPQEDEDLGGDVRLSVHSLGAGARWSPRAGTTVVPFLQVILGVARLSARGEILGTTIGDSSSNFMLQPGGGVNLNLNDTWGLVGQLDYRRVLLDEDEHRVSGANQFRVFVGLRVGL